MQKREPLRVFGLPVVGVILPYIGRRRIPLNRDGSIVETTADDILDERGFYYVEPVVFEWLGFGFPLTDAYVHLTSTGQQVDVDFTVAGGR